MTRFGFTLMTEQNGPRELVDAAVRAEEVGFDLLVSSDHYSPWLTEQGHAPYAWTVLGAVAHATRRVDLMTYVTCPTMRYHPAVVAQKAATLQIADLHEFAATVAGKKVPDYSSEHDLLVQKLLLEACGMAATK